MIRTNEVVIITMDGAKRQHRQKPDQLHHPVRQVPAAGAEIEVDRLRHGRAKVGTGSASGRWRASEMKAALTYRSAALAAWRDVKRMSRHGARAATGYGARDVPRLGGGLQEAALAQQDQPLLPVQAAPGRGAGWASRFRLSIDLASRRSAWGGQLQKALRRPSRRAWRRRRRRSGRGWRPGRTQLGARLSEHRARLAKRTICLGRSAEVPYRPINHDRETGNAPVNHKLGKIAPSPEVRASLSSGGSSHELGTTSRCWPC